MSPLPTPPPQATWHATGSGVFPYTARADGRRWVLRLNDFPEHPLFTLFVDGRVVGDLDDAPAAWRLPPRTTPPALTVPERAEVLRLMAGLGPYGAETGSPCTGDHCTGDHCTCSILTDEYAARRDTPREPLRDDVGGSDPARPDAAADRM
ncbi:hypothetical protein [Kitasatospora sp. NPDC057015]|uniref:hypothetical protein n=1 Tax=Kitasatospora sp. NPDC057015 TaxID=3346001 RepID=UPI0036340930